MVKNNLKKLDRIYAKSGKGTNIPALVTEFLSIEIKPYNCGDENSFTHVQQGIPWRTSVFYEGKPYDLRTESVEYVLGSFLAKLNGEKEYQKFQRYSSLKRSFEELMGVPDTEFRINCNNERNGFDSRFFVPAHISDCLSRRTLVTLEGQRLSESEFIKGLEQLRYYNFTLAEIF